MNVDGIVGMIDCKIVKRLSCELGSGLVRMYRECANTFETSGVDMGVVQC